THDESPSGGVAAVLDEIGDERNIPRLEGEQDEEYRLRIAEPSDVVSPNAIRRAGNRVLRSLGLEVCLREVGSRLLPGMFFDEGPTNAPSAFDLEGVDVVLSSPSSFVHGEQVRQVFDGIETVVTYLDNGASDGVIVRVRGPGLVPGSIESVKSSTSNTIVSATRRMQPTHRFAVMLRLLEFRAFYRLGVPPLPPDDR